MGKKVEKGASARIPDWSKTGISRCVEEVPHLTAEYMQMRRREDHSVSANSMGDRETTGRVDVVVVVVELLRWWQITTKMMVLSMNYQEKIRGKDWMNIFKDLQSIDRIAIIRNDS